MSEGFKRFFGLLAVVAFLVDIYGLAQAITESPGGWIGFGIVVLNFIPVLMMAVLLGFPIFYSIASRMLSGFLGVGGVVLLIVGISSLGIYLYPSSAWYLILPAIGAFVGAGLLIQIVTHEMKVHERRVWILFDWYLISDEAREGVESVENKINRLFLKRPGVLFLLFFLLFVVMLGWCKYSDKTDKAISCDKISKAVEKIIVDDVEGKVNPELKSKLEAACVKAI